MTPLVDAQLPGHLPATLPVLHIWGGKDPTATPWQRSRMRETTGKLEEIEVPSKGHWIMVQAREEVTGAVLRWLSSLSLSQSSSSRL